MCLFKQYLYLNCNFILIIVISMNKISRKIMSVVHLYSSNKLLFRFLKTIALDVYKCIDYRTSNDLEGC